MSIRSMAQPGGGKPRIGRRFVVTRRLLIGKAWVVYFPATYAMSENGKAFVPDFGRMRFIR